MSSRRLVTILVAVVMISINPCPAQAGRWVWHTQGINSGWRYEHDASDYSNLSEPPQATRPNDNAVKDATNTVDLRENKYHRLMNKYVPDKSLDIINDSRDNKPIMADSGNFTGQMWKFEAVGDGYYRITNNFQQGKSLSIVNDDRDTELLMMKTGNFDGQKWKLSPMGGGYYRIINKWQHGKSLATYNDGKKVIIYMAKTSIATSQNWRIVD